jgi:hypothetical protein
MLPDSLQHRQITGHQGAPRAARSSPFIVKPAGSSAAAVARHLPLKRLAAFAPWRQQPFTAQAPRSCLRI